MPLPYLSRSALDARIRAELSTLASSSAREPVCNLLDLLREDCIRANNEREGNPVELNAQIRLLSGILEQLSK